MSQIGNTSKSSQEMVLRMIRGQEQIYVPSLNRQKIFFTLNVLLDINDNAFDLIKKYEIGNSTLIPFVRYSSLKDGIIKMDELEQKHKKRVKTILTVYLIAFLISIPLFFLLFITIPIGILMFVFRDRIFKKPEMDTHTNLKISDLTKKGGIDFITDEVWELKDYQAMAKKSFLLLNSYLDMLANFDGEETLDWKKIKDEIESKEYKEEQDMIKEIKSNEKKSHL